MTYTTRQISAAVVDSFGDFAEFCEIIEGSKEPVVIESIDEPAFYVDGQPGSEGGGESVWVIFRVGDQLFQKSGYYSSYDGVDWDGYEIEEVEPYEKTVTFYRSKS